MRYLIQAAALVGSATCLSGCGGNSFSDALANFFPTSAPSPNYSAPATSGGSYYPSNPGPAAVTSTTTLWAWCSEAVFEKTGDGGVRRTWYYSYIAPLPYTATNWERMHNNFRRWMVQAEGVSQDNGRTIDCQESQSATEARETQRSIMAQFKRDGFDESLTTWTPNVL